MTVKILVNTLNRENRFLIRLRQLFRLILLRSAEKKIHMFESKLRGKKVLDIGTGNGAYAKRLTEKGYKVRGLDVVRKSLFPEIPLDIYDGSRIPAKENSYDTALLICVLHHCTDQLQVLREAMRVSSQIIILEDTYRNKLEKWLVGARDAVGNFEFYPHQYRRADDWEKIFKDYNWRVISKREFSNVSIYGMYGRQTLFIIEAPTIKHKR